MWNEQHDSILQKEFGFYFSLDNALYPNVWISCGTGISRLVSLPRTSPVSSAHRRAGFAIFLRGLWIFLSFRPAFPSLEEGDYIVLNSVSNLQKAFSFLSRYDGICCCLDNDTAGKNAVQALKDKYGIRICDLSHEYSGYKDLNEYLCGKNDQPYII